ncbi:MAG TPA: hypothetical protein VGX03_15055 [Candidatus Binatia bacterium]|jgi:hypothetical protein|nr:hypothetical protein [Candidatus Binatia bacterium]
MSGREKTNTRPKLSASELALAKRMSVPNPLRAISRYQKRHSAKDATPRLPAQAYRAR